MYQTYKAIIIIIYVLPAFLSLSQKLYYYLHLKMKTLRVDGTNDIPGTHLLAVCPRISYS